jgi:arginine-tRNA-protein transferase
VDRFQPNRTQQRILRRNAGLQAIERPAVYDEAQYRLYVRYLAARHPDSAMGDASPRDYLQFLGNPRWEGTRFIEFREADRLLAVAVIDQVIDGFSAVYTFYEPDEARRSLGVNAILWQIAEVKRRGGFCVYLGFWVAECPKMAYKSGFRPIEILTGNRWTNWTNRNL